MLFDALIATPLPFVLEAGAASGPSALPLLVELAAAGAVAVAFLLRARMRRLLAAARRRPGHGPVPARARRV